LSLIASCRSSAAHEIKQQPKTLKNAAMMGRVRVAERRVWRDGRSMVWLNMAELADDLANLPRCKIQGCEATVLLTSDYCREHYNLPGRQQAESIRRAELSAERDYYTGTEAVSVSGLSCAKICQAAKDGE
jgi:hypothetical protein